MNFLHIAVLVGIILECIAARNYYQILGLEKSATKKDIRKAFKSLALKHHPDKNPDADPSKFMEIKEAYDVLHDEDKRRSYDIMGHDSYVNQGGSNNNHHHFKQGHQNFHFDFGSFDDLFKDFDDDFGFDFDGFGGGHFHQQTFGNMDREFLDLDAMFGDAYTFGESAFGSQDSFFANFKQNDHMKQHRQAHNQAHHNARFGGHAHAQAHAHAGFGHHHVNVNSGGAGRSCKTVTQRVGNMVTTYTTCS